MRAFLAERMKTLTQSEIRNMTRECERVGGINLGQGLGDLPTPPLVRKGAEDAIEARKNTYAFPEGVLELRQAIAAKMQRDNKLNIDPQKGICVTVGSTGAFAATLMGLLNPGDGLLLLEPYYGYHVNCATVAGVECQFLTLQPPEFALHEDKLRAAIKPNTRAIVMCTPSNPSGKMFTRSELEILERVAVEKDLLVITDEVYEYLIYDGREHISPATVGRLGERTVSISGLSKTFSITGWRIGYAAGPEKLIGPITLVNDLFYVCAPTPLQHGVFAGFSAPREFFTQLAADYQRKRDIICEALDKAGLRPVKPQGAYYVMADVSHLGYPTSKAAAMALLEASKVASVPGMAFYQSKTGEGLLRFCYAKEDSILIEAGKRIQAFKG